MEQRPEGHPCEVGSRGVFQAYWSLVRIITGVESPAAKRVTVFGLPLIVSRLFLTMRRASARTLTRSATIFCMQRFTFALYLPVTMGVLPLQTKA
jgi:hypothetical protein